MKAIINKLSLVEQNDGLRFTNMLEKEYPNESFEFRMDNTDEDLYWIFLNEYLRNNSHSILSHNGKVFIRPNGNPEKLICGIAPMWKEYDSCTVFEQYYSNSEMMRELYCNEKDENEELIPIYLKVNDDKYIVTWENIDNEDVFHYRQATLAEIGSLDILWNIFGGTVDDDNLKVINTHIGMVCGDIIAKGYGFDLVNVKNLCEHIKNLGYSIKNIDFKYLTIE